VTKFFARDVIASAALNRKQGEHPWSSSKKWPEKISEALNAAAKCSGAETEENYSALNEQLLELTDNTLVGQSVQSHINYAPVLGKLQSGTALTADELKTLRSLIVGDADQYLKYDNDFARSKSELFRIFSTKFAVYNRNRSIWRR
jgi:hypothetical protein